jgi:glycosyltransferase involved in cell wall biosynthesis
MLRKGGGGLPITLRKYWRARVQLAPFLVGHMATLSRVARTCDIVHAHWTVSGAAGVWTRGLHRRPVLVTVQGSDVFQVPRLPFGRRFTQAVLNGADHVTTLSAALQLGLIQLDIAPEHISVIPNGVDLRQFAPPDAAARPREEVVLFVGWLIARKGVQHLLDAVPAVLERYPRCRFILVGDGPERLALESRTQNLGVTHAVEFCGYQPQDAVRAWMRRARLFVLPSVEEGQGVVLLEALASGTPVIGSRVDGIVDVVTPEVGALFPAGDSAALAAAIIEILADEPRWRALSAAARRRAETEYDWDDLAQQYLAEYKRLLGAP